MHTLANAARASSYFQRKKCKSFVAVKQPGRRGCWRAGNTRPSETASLLHDGENVLFGRPKRRYQSHFQGFASERRVLSALGWHWCTFHRVSFVHFFLDWITICSEADEGKNKSSAYPPPPPAPPTYARLERKKASGDISWWENKLLTKLTISLEMLRWGCLSFWSGVSSVTQDPHDAGFLLFRQMC